MSRQKASLRYSDIERATDTGHLPRSGKYCEGIEIRHGAVDDPYPVFRKKQRVAINIRTDALENEYARGRILEPAYRAGRVWQAIMERGMRLQGGGQWRDGGMVDACTAHELAIIRSLDTAAKAVRIRREAMPVIGTVGIKLFELTLVQRLTIGEAVYQLTGLRHKNIRASYAKIFRRSLDDLADHWDRIGR